jgi:hypothetical protein
MRKPDTYLDEIRAIRDRIDAETANMTSEERTAYFNQRCAEAARIYGFKFDQNPQSREQSEKLPAE